MIRDATGASAVTAAAQPRPTPAAQPGGAPATTADEVLGVNPRLRIDPALNLVVIEFRDDTGEVRDSIPSPRELAAYREQPLESEPPAIDVTR